MKSRSMRDNLIFSNIQEKENETPDVTEHILHEFLELNLKMEKQDVTNITFDPCSEKTTCNCGDIL